MQGSADRIMLKKQSLIKEVPVSFDEPAAFTGVWLQIISETKSAAVSRELSSPEDFYFEGGTITFTRGFLLSLPSFPLGEVARLYCKFADAPEWVVHVFQYDGQEPGAVGSGGEPPAAPPENMLKRAINNPFVKIGAGALVVAAVATGVIKRLISKK
ncbi:MAG: hypothetical protein LBR83_00920 [Clostridiales bacterium]|jgi:hypothetical protein|nr:hypothetical protein [Clostridiales bacterium]